LTVGTLDYLASTVGELGRNDEAEQLSRRVLEIRERLKLIRKNEKVFITGPGEQKPSHP